MSTLRVILSLHAVGPRDHLLDLDTIPFALQLSAGFEGDVPDAARKAWATAALPWEFCLPLPGGDDGRRDQLELRLYRGVTNDLNTIGVVRAHRLGYGPRHPFLSALAQGVVDRFVNDQMVLQRLALSWDANKPVAASETSPHWGAIIQSLSVLPPEIASGVSAAWYFEVPRDALFKNVGGTFTPVVPYFIAAPVRLRDGRHDREASLQGKREGPSEVTFEYEDVKALPAIRAIGPAFPLASLGAEAGGGSFSLGDYWLSVKDSRGVALADVDGVLAQALEPRVMAAEVDQDVVGRVLRIRDGGAPRRATGEQAELFRTLAGQTSLEDAIERDLMAESVLAGLKNAGTDDARTVLRRLLGDALSKRWKDLAGSTVAAARERGLLRDGEMWELDDAGADELARPLVEHAVARNDTAVVRTALPGEGLDFVAGASEHRLVHEENSSFGSNREGAYSVVSGVGVLVRRWNDKATAESRPWRLVTAGVPHLASRGEWFELEPLPLTAGFLNGVLRSDRTYLGEPMRTPSTLVKAHAYRAPENEKRPGDPTALEDLEFLSIAHYRAANEAEAPNAGWASAPPLRYGDGYDVAAFVVDKAGGLPVEMARWREQPVTVDWSSLRTLAPRGFARITFLRRVPVGAVNVLPGAKEDAMERAAWPAIPDGVALRSREWYRGANLGSGDSPALLLSTHPDWRGTLRDYSFRVEPPRLDEHTLLRWAVPALGSKDAVTETKRLRDAWVRILAWRDAETARDPEGKTPRYSVPGLPHDPAVTALGFRLTKVDASGAGAEPKLVVVPLEERAPFEMQPIQVTVAASETTSISSANASVTVTLKEGDFAAFEVCALVLETDFSRFEGEAMKELVEARLWPHAGTAYRAFCGTTLLLEGATNALPEAEDLFGALGLQEREGRIHVTLQGRPGDLHFVDTVEIERERWVWRNRPLVMSASSDEGPEERRRRLASGLPNALSDAAMRDVDGRVREFDAIAGPDRGFVDRGTVRLRLPRDGDGGGAPNALLLVDERDGSPSGDYLSYGLRVRSRYAPVLPPNEREVLAVRAASESPANEPDDFTRRWRTRRRVVGTYRGGPLKPPKILAVVPLTRDLTDEPGRDTHTPGVPPHLVLVDEVWFREYGPGERLEARLVLETREIGEAEDGARPYRTGPMPDHHLAPPAGTETKETGTEVSEPNRYYRHRMRSDTGDEEDPILLDVFGPFGYTVDRSGNEALANATAFLVYLPNDVGPHWCSYVRFSRVLDGPGCPEPRRSERSGLYPLYTRPDAGRLASGDEGGLLLAGGIARLTGGLKLLLDPIAVPSGKPAAASETLARRNYRYLLLVSRAVVDAAQGVEVELPQNLYRLTGTKLNKDRVEFREGQPLMATPIGDQARPGEYRGRILEVLVNGVYEDGRAPLDDAKNVKDFLRRLLPTPKEPREGDRLPYVSELEDAPGLLLPISCAFPVRVEDEGPPEALDPKVYMTRPPKPTPNDMVTLRFRAVSTGAKLEYGPHAALPGFTQAFEVRVEDRRELPSTVHLEGSEVTPLRWACGSLIWRTFEDVTSEGFLEYGLDLWKETQVREFPDDELRWTMPHRIPASILPGESWTQEVEELVRDRDGNPKGPRRYTRTVTFEGFEALVPSGEAFNECARVREDFLAPGDGGAEWIVRWFAPGIGEVRSEDSGGSVWELLATKAADPEAEKSVGPPPDRPALVGRSLPLSLKNGESTMTKKSLSRKATPRRGSGVISTKTGKPTSLRGTRAPSDRKVVRKTAARIRRRVSLTAGLESASLALAAANVPTASKKPNERVNAFWAIAEAVAQELDQPSVRYRAKVFLLRVAWHESARLTTRLQGGGGPARGLLQFETIRAEEAGGYAEQKGYLKDLSRVSSRTEAALKGAFAALHGHATYPSGNLIEDLLSGNANANDHFCVLLGRIALKRGAKALPDEADLGATADYWYCQWNHNFSDKVCQASKNPGDPNNADRNDKIQAFLSSCAALAEHLPSS